EAMTMADHIVVMHDGVIEQQGRPIDVYDNPQNLFVAGFIGSPGMNMIRGKVASDGGAPVVVTADSIHLPLPADTQAKAGQAVIYGVRPEHLVPDRTGGTVEARISVVEPTGPEDHIYASIGKAEVCAVSRDRTEYVPQDTVLLAPDLERIHVFDETSGKVIARG
ncbi:MAG: TOBE domain-containing protein, partial [Rhodobiaceae bacterium]|nr:TOBE domain-containing protein [Rhodobiaceae bacterium]